MTALGANANAALVADRAEAWRRHLIVLAIVTVALLIGFRDDVETLASIWWTSTTFGHCLFIGPVVAWLVWQRREGLSQLMPAPWWPSLVIVGCGGAGWLAGAAASVDLVRQLGLLLMLQGAVVTILGAQVARALLFPLCYAIFLVPFGEGLEPPLQRVTVALIMPLLHLMQVPAHVDGVLITIPNGYFEVAEACSGAKFEIAMIAFGALVANVCFLSWRRRIAFLAVALTVPILANELRAFATIYVAHLTSVERATGYDHIVYGWVFFGLVMAAVLAIGWRWFDRDPRAAWFDPDSLPRPTFGRIALLPAALLVLGVAAIFPTWNAAIAGRAEALPEEIVLPAIPGWQRVPLSTRAPWAPYYPAADRYLFGRYQAVDGPGKVDVGIAVFGSQREGKEIVTFGTGVLRQNDSWVRVEDLPDLDGGSVMRITAPGHIERIVATWYRIGDVVTANPNVVKLQTLKLRLLGGPQRAIALHLSVEVEPGVDARATLGSFVRAIQPIDRFADRVASGGA